MLIHSKDLYEKLEFNKVLASIKSYCQGELGKAFFDTIEIGTTLSGIKELHEEVGEWLKSHEEETIIPFSIYDDISDDIPLLKKEGYVLEIEAIQKIHQILITAYGVNNFFQDYQKHKLYPRLTKKALAIQIQPTMYKEIERIFDETGEVRPNASEALSKLSKSISNKEREVYKVFKSELGQYKSYLAENMESVRNNRMVLVVAAEHKRRIPGIIHDESSTGKTVYIEPDGTIAINNDIHSLYSERRAEIYRIIKELCNFLRPYANDILEALNSLVDLDTIRAKAHYARSIGAKIPQLVSQPTFDFREAYNPVLLQKHKALNLPVVPFNLHLHGDNRILVLSGPNAGGKSVSMKSVGLLQLMVQAGIPVTANENSIFGVFKGIFADIGDQQSIEDDLSTYSSHLTNMNNLLQKADNHTLFLIDEFGAGTDPKLGGAIAEAILKQLLHQRSFGVVTTHYSNLKFFAHNTKGLVNASMEFDKMQLKPTYNLLVGKPGSSFAFEIADKIGLPANVLEYAQTKAGKNERAVEELLIELEADRQEFQAKMLKVIEKEERVDKLLKNYQELSLDLEFKRKKLKKEQKEAYLQAMSDATKEAQKMIKDLKQEKDLEKAQKVLDEQKLAKTKIISDIKSIKEDIYHTNVKFSKPLVVGDFVKMIDGTSVGEIVAIDKGVAEVQMGILKLRTPLSELLPANEPIQINKRKSVDLSNISGMGKKVETKLDIRGYRVDDAMWFVEEFVDKALMNNAFELRIIHGVGNGVLKKNLHKKLREYKDIKEVWHPEADYGGEGVTLIRL